MYSQLNGQERIRAPGGAIRPHLARQRLSPPPPRRSITEAVSAIPRLTPGPLRRRFTIEVLLAITQFADLGPL